MPTVDRSSSSPYSTTTCLLKCIMSLSVERMTGRNVIYYVNTTMNCVITVFTHCVRSVKDFFPPFGPYYFRASDSFQSLLKESDAIFSHQMRESPIRGDQIVEIHCVSMFKLNRKTDKRTRIDSSGQDLKLHMSCQLTRVKDGVRLLFDRNSEWRGSFKGEVFMGELGPNFISCLF